MTGYNFTDQVRYSLQAAREEAVRLGHEYLGTEHILLGILRCRGSVALDLLASLGLQPDLIRRDLLETLLPGSATVGSGPDLPYTSRAKRVLELAMTEAHQLEHSYVGTEHLLLGLVVEEQGLAARVLTAHNATANRLRAETIRRHAAGQRDGDNAPARIESVTVIIEHSNGHLDAAKFGSTGAAIAFLAETKGAR